MGAHIVKISRVKGRIIVVGDVHGCAGELAELLRRVCPVHGDRLIATGDFAGKGPAVADAMALWRDVGGESVLGNNDARFLEAAERGEDVRRENRPLLDHPGLLEWMRGFPLWIEIEEIDAAIVHGGFFPDRSIAEHDTVTDRDAVMRLRAVRKEDGRWTYIPKRDARPDDPFWATLWRGPLAIYGHTPQKDSLPRRDAAAIGIDTSCVYGGRLTAVVFDPAAEDRWSVVSVDAHRAWAPPPDSWGG